MAQSILVPLIPALTFVFSAILMLYLYRESLFRCFSHESKTAVYTELPSDIESAPPQIPENPACGDPPPSTEPRNTPGWIDLLVERAVHQVWTRLDLNSLFEPASPVHHGTAV